MGLFSSSKSKDKVDIKKVYKWEKKDLLGTGNFAEVYKATIIDGKDRPFKTAEDEGDNKTGKIPGKDQVAVKVIDKAKVEDMNDITREIEIMQQVTHPNIIQLYEVFEGGQKNVSLVMELVTGGELFDRIVEKGSYTEKDAAKCIYQLCDALNYLHAKKIVHRDLKPENLLYAKPDPDETIKVADFGLAREVAGGGDLMKTACGTPGYVAPEILANKGYDNTAVDMWSVGVILYILLCGFPPFYEEELPALFDSILKARYDFPSPWWDNITPSAKELVKMLLELDVTKRLTAKQVMDHKFNEEASAKNLDSTQKALRKYMANQRLRKAALGIIAQQRMQRALAQLRATTS